MRWSPDLSAKFVSRTRELALGDPTQDLFHFKQVVGAAGSVNQAGNGRSDTVISAAWLHNFVWRALHVEFS